MANGFTTFLKRCRDNYYLSMLLANPARHLSSASRGLALRLQHSVRKNGVTIQLPNGKNLTLGRDAGVGLASLLFWHGLDGYEPETSRTLRSLFERAATFIDLGANCGLYSILGPLWNPNLQVVSFEPVPEIFERLTRNVRLNQLEGRVRCENAALSSQSGRAVLFLPAHQGADPETTGTLTVESWQARKGSPRLEVETLRFDDYEARHPIRVDLIKIDVEDFEADVLEGMRATIMRDRPFIICEVLPRPHRNLRTREIVASLNYQLYWITPAGYIRVQHFDFARGDFTDFLLSPVSTPDAVIDNPGMLWELKQQES
jgi:FkbM family methyltransferase